MEELNYVSNIILTKTYYNALCEMFNPIRVYINDSCVYDDSNDLVYCIGTFFKDVEYMSKICYTPIIRNIEVHFCDFHHSEIYIDVEFVRESNFASLAEAQDIALKDSQCSRVWVE